MISKTMRPPSSERAFLNTLLFIAIGFGVALGCKRGDDKKAATETAVASASPQGSAAPGATSQTSPECTDLQTKICAAAGETSSLCQSSKATLGVLSSAACAAAVKDFEKTAQKIKDERRGCDELIEKLCAGVGPDTETCKMVREKTQEFPTERCTQMMAQSDAIIADLKQQEAANQPLTAELQASIAKPDAPAFGPADSKVTVVEFSDFECPYCSRAASVVTQLRAKYGEKIRFVFRQFPLSFHKNAGPAAEAALAAHAQGKFWEFHDKLFENQRSLDSDSIEGFAKEAGLDMAKFKKALKDNEFADAVKADLKLGEQAAVRGTPTLFVNGARVANPTDLAAVSQAIDSALGS